MSFQSENHGRYLIKSGPLRGAWGANAFRRDVPVVKAIGVSREEAVDKVKSELERIEAVELSERDQDGAPSAKIYEQAFGILLARMPDSYRAMLRAHLAAPDYLISATRLAEAAGYSGYEGANLHYGKLGQLVADEIGFDPPKRDDGTEIWTCAIARDPAIDAEYPHTSMLHALERNFATGHFEWQLRPQVAQALKALGF